ncbi:hypothetical protein GN956_G20468 [Arapaima gigas]
MERGTRSARHRGGEHHSNSAEETVLTFRLGDALCLPAGHQPLSDVPPPLEHADPEGKAQASIPVQYRYEEEDDTYVTSGKQYASLAKDSKLGIFIAASVGTLTLMGMVYCIYSQFYNKNPYAHTQLQDDTELTLDLTEPSTSFIPHNGVTVNGEKGLWKASYGSLSEAPSIIPLPPTESLVPRSVPFPSRCLAHTSPLQTISARDLEKGFI